MIRPIILWPNELLHQKSAPVDFERMGLVIKELVADLFESMYSAGGIGLSAIQIGIPFRIFVVEVYQQRYMFINPVIKDLGGIRESKNEGCLSLPGWLHQVDRYDKVTITAQDENGQEFTQVFVGLEAQAIQHENEHLDGIILPDKMNAIERMQLKKFMEKKKDK